jgi:hypothetical protein
MSWRIKNRLAIDEDTASEAGVCAQWEATSRGAAGSFFT